MVRGDLAQHVADVTLIPASLQPTLGSLKGRRSCHAPSAKSNSLKWPSFLNLAYRCAMTSSPDMSLYLCTTSWGSRSAYRGLACGQAPVWLPLASA